MNSISMSPMSAPRFGRLTKNLRGEYLTATIKQFAYSQANKAVSGTEPKEPDAQVSALLGTLNQLLYQSRALDELDHPLFETKEKLRDPLPKDEDYFQKYKKDADGHLVLRNHREERRQAIYNEIFRLEDEFNQGLKALTADQKLTLAAQALKVCSAIERDLLYTPSDSSAIARALHKAIKPLLDLPASQLPDDFWQHRDPDRFEKGFRPDKFDPFGKNEK